MYLFAPDKDADFVNRDIINDVYRIHRVTNSWVPHETSWKSRNDDDEIEWSPWGAEFDSTFDDSQTFSCKGWKTWSITTMTRYWVEHPAENYGFLIECNVEDDNNDEVKFHSSHENKFDPEGKSTKPKLALYYLDARSP